MQRGAKAAREEVAGFKRRPCTATPEMQQKDGFASDKLHSVPPAFAFLSLFVPRNRQNGLGRESLLNPVCRKGLRNAPCNPSAGSGWSRRTRFPFAKC